MQSLEEMHKIAEDNKKEIEDIKVNARDFVDSCFLKDFKTKVSYSLRTRLERRVTESANCGRTSFNESFSLKYYGLVSELVNGGSSVGRIEVCRNAGGGPWMIFQLDYIWWDLPSEQRALIDAAGIKDYVLSLEAIKTAYELWLDVIKNIGFTIVRADNFELSEKEYKKLTRRSLFEFEKVFDVELSF